MRENLKFLLESACFDWSNIFVTDFVRKWVGQTCIYLLDVRIVFLSQITVKMCVRTTTKTHIHTHTHIYIYICISSWEPREKDLFFWLISNLFGVKNVFQFWKVFLPVIWHHVHCSGPRHSLGGASFVIISILFLLSWCRLLWSLPVPLHPDYLKHLCQRKLSSV